MRIGIFGGTFDPPHIGHRLLAIDVCEELGLDRLFVIPAGNQPFKQRNPPVANAKQRLDMAALAFKDVRGAIVDDVETSRDGLSYTVDTVEHFARGFPDAELILLIGRDNYESLDGWKNPARIRELCKLAVLERGHGVRGDAKSSGSEIIHVTLRRIDVSSTEIRQRVRKGKSVSAFVPEAVEKYILDTGLYR